MSSSSNNITPNKWVTVAALTGFAVAAVGYVVYFDYKRRNDAAFRKKLQKQKDEAKAEMAKVEAKVKVEEVEEAEIVQKAMKSNQQLPFPEMNGIPAMMTEKLDKVDLPLEVLRQMPPEEQQKVFYSVLAVGEALMGRGQEGRKKAIEYFVKAANLVPSPAEVLSAFSQVLDKETYDEVIKHFSREGLKKQQAYLDTIVTGQDCFKFVMKSSDKDDEEATWSPIAVQSIEANKELIRELPDIAWHSSKLEYCDHCHNNLSSEVLHCERCGELNYCSDACRRASLEVYHIFVCRSVNPSSNAFKILQEYAEKNETIAPLIMFRYLALLLAEEGKGNGSAAGGPFMHYDHLRPVMKTPNKADKRETELIKNIFAFADANMAEFLRDDIYACMKATVMMHVLGTPTHTNDITKIAKPEPVRFSGDSHNSDLVGLYHTLAHFPHSCDPNCELVPSDGASIVLKSIKKIERGDQLTISYAPLQNMERDERRQLLRQRFFTECTCTKCMTA
jgi:import receptor subunit TOM20